jgi:hypothetical protein
MPVSIGSKNKEAPMIRLTTLLMMGLLVSATAVRAEPPAIKGEHASQPSAPPPSKSDSSDVGYHDLICKPNGTEDGFDCADEATPGKIVPIPSQMAWPRQQDLQVSG